MQFNVHNSRRFRNADSFPGHRSGNGRRAVGNRRDKTKNARTVAGARVRDSSGITLPRGTQIVDLSGPQPARGSRHAISLTAGSLVILPASSSSIFFPARAARLPNWMLAVIGPE